VLAVTFKEQLIITLTDKLIIGLLLLSAGFWVSREVESFKALETRRSEEIKVKIAIIDKQLSEFYWPIVFRIEKDNAVWNRLKDPDQRLAREIEQQVILPNHREILKILDERADAAFNGWEPVQPELTDAIKLYQRHVAVYVALRSVEDKRMPEDLKEPWPQKFYPLLQRRIKQLQDQRSKLVE
jgi:hypothetical protein